MATNKRALAICDSCGMRYSHRVMKKSSYNTIRCPQCFDGNFDLKNHPQNRAPDVRDDPTIKDPRPDDGGRNLTWQLANITWNNIPEPNTRKWSTV
mgnify:CR=1 FL=1